MKTRKPTTRRVMAAAVAAVLGWSAAAWATPAKDFSSDVTKGFFDEIRILATTNGAPPTPPGPSHHPHGHKGKHHGPPDRDWSRWWDQIRVKIISKDPSDVYVVTNTVAPGGYSGWHTHPGPSVVIVKSGTATLYDGDDPNCAPVTVPAGSGFIDPGDGHVHMLRNEGAEPLITIAFQVIPTGLARRIDAAASSYCAF